MCDREMCDIKPINQNPSPQNIFKNWLLSQKKKKRPGTSQNGEIVQIASFSDLSVIKLEINYKENKASILEMKNHSAK